MRKSLRKSSYYKVGVRQAALAMGRACPCPGPLRIPGIGPFLHTVSWQTTLSFAVGSGKWLGNGWMEQVRGVCVRTVLYCRVL